MHKFLFYNKFISRLYMFRAPCAHHQEVRTVPHTYMCDDTRGCMVQFWPPHDGHMVLETCRGVK